MQYCDVVPEHVVDGPLRVRIVQDSNDAFVMNQDPDAIDAMSPAACDSSADEASQVIDDIEHDQMHGHGTTSIQASHVVTAENGPLCY